MVNVSCRVNALKPNQTWLRRNAFYKTKQKRCLNVDIHVLIHYVSTPLHITLRPSTLCHYTSPYTITLGHNTLCQYTSPYTITLRPNIFCQYTPLHITLRPNTLCQYTSSHYITSQYTLLVHLFTLHYVPIHSVSTLLPTRFYLYNNCDDPLRQYTS